MNDRFPADTRYRVGRWLHWLVAIVFIVMLVGTDIWVEYTSNSAERKQLYYWHISIGVAFLLLLFFRTGWIMIYPPRRSRFASRWQAIAARANHHALYLLVILVPLSGLISLLADGEPVYLFQLFTLEGPEWLFDEELAYYAEEVHLFLKWPAYALLVLHAAGALSHWLVGRLKG